MARRQLFLVILLGCVGYLWWQSSRPSRYSDWTAGTSSDAELSVLDSPFEQADAVHWEFASPGDSVWRVSRVTDGRERYRVVHSQGDSLVWRLFIDIDSQGVCRNFALLSAGKAIKVEPHGDSARFLASGETTTDAWIPWSEDAVPYDAICALCDTWWPISETSVTLVRIQPQTEVVTQLPGRLHALSPDTLQLQAAGKELVTIGYESGRAARICLAGGRCIVRRSASHP